jgi:hypothetical protein
MFLGVLRNTEEKLKDLKNSRWARAARGYCCDPWVRWPEQTQFTNVTCSQGFIERETIQFITDFS